MIGIFDVDYVDDLAVVGCVAIEDFADAEPAREWVVQGGPVGPYVPGEFYRRELGPLIRAVRSTGDLSVCVIDAYVDLGEDASPGLGRILFEQTGVPVIGVAKSRYPGTPTELEVLRGASKRPLFVSAAGFDSDRARKCVQRMAGAGRVPAMIRRADQLARTSA
jgi:deoxyribonuclease V